MTEQILTADEKSALLDGVSSGAVQVQSNGGPKYASVRPFEIAPQSRIVTNSYPRLQTINHRFAERLARRAEALLQCSLDVRPIGIELKPFREFRTQVNAAGPGVASVFEAAPLKGNALAFFQKDLVGCLVEVFFGGPGIATGANGSASFSAGELSVANLFCNLALETIQDCWQALVQFAPLRSRTETSLDHVELCGDSDAVIDTRFEVSLADHHGGFHILWPRDMVAALLPAFDGRKRERDAANDARWEKALRRRIGDASMKISTRVGHARLALGELALLAPGDIIPIDSPRFATILAGGVPLLNGRFGVFDGRNAVEAGEWLPPGSSLSSTVR